MKLLKHNWQWKLTSLIIGILMWSYITAGVNPTQSATLSDIPIRIINQDALEEKELKITEMEFEQTSLRILGKRNDLGSLDRNFVVASIDASTLKEGTQAVPIRFSVPANVMINETANSRVQVQVEKVITKSRTVNIKETGTLADNYVLRGLAATPQSIEVTGPRSAVERVAKVNVVINLNGLTADTSANLQVHPVDENDNTVEGINLSLSSVNVSATISKQKEVPVQLQLGTPKGQEPKVRVRQSAVTPNTVLVMGKTADIDKLTAIPTQPLALSKVTKDGLFPVTLRFPDGITPVNDKLEYKAQITLDVREERSFSVNVDRIQSKNGGSLKARPAGDVKTITLRLEGYKNDLDALHDSDMVITANLTGVGTGLQTLPLEVNLPKDVVLKEIKPAQLLMNVE